MPALVTRARPVRDLVVRQPGRRQRVVGLLVLVGLVVVVRMAFGRGGERRTGFNGQSVRGDVGRPEGQGCVERGGPIGRRLPHCAVDEIEVERIEPGVANVRDRPGDVRRIVRTTEGGEDVRHHRLHAEADARHTVAPVRGEQFGRHRVGVALHRHLGVGDDRHRIEHRAERVAGHHRRRAATDEDARRRRHAGRHRPLYLDAHGVEIGLGEVMPIRPRGEGAVVAPMGAERYVDVDAEGAGRLGHRSHPGQRTAGERRPAGRGRTGGRRRPRWGRNGGVRPSAGSAVRARRACAPWCPRWRRGCRRWPEGRRCGW